MDSVTVAVLSGAGGWTAQVSSAEANEDSTCLFDPARRSRTLMPIYDEFRIAAPVYRNRRCFESILSGTTMSPLF